MRHMTRKPVANLKLDASVGTPIATGAWSQVIALTTQPSSQVEIRNTTGSVMELSLQAAGFEDTLAKVPYYILPDGSPILIPLEIAKNKRVSVKAVDVAATEGSLIFNFFE